MVVSIQTKEGINARGCNPLLVINVDELWLKGKNRPMYFKAIRDHVRELLGAYHTDRITVENEEQRMVAHSDTPFSEEAIQALLKVPGVHSVMPAIQIPVSLEVLIDTVIEELKRLKNEFPGDAIPFLTPGDAIPFKVQTRRSCKEFPMTSMEVSAKIGEEILKEFPHFKVSLKSPKLVVEIRILKNNIYVATRKLMAIGGLPVGTSGHSVTLISGGFDSPVASYLMAKRGLRQTFIFFYAYPFVGEEVKDKIFKLIQILGKHQRFSRLVVVAIGEVQNLISKHCDMDYRTLLFRKAMIRCATLLAQKVRADALVTGDALGQVSSQTIWNISALDKVTELPIFRPLIGFNKIEIIELAKKIGTHDVSIVPYDDACSLFAPKHPIIKPNTAYLAKFDNVLQLDEPLIKALQEAEIFDISLTGQVSPSNLNLR